MHITIHDKTFRVLIDQASIASKVKEVGCRISNDYKGRIPVLLVILKGSFVFASDLFRSIDIPTEVSFVRLNSYIGDASSGQVQTHMGISENLEGREVIIVEDIIDTGTTLHNFLLTVQACKPASIKVASFLVKPDALIHQDVKADYSCFEIEDKFVVGYGLDYDEQGRNLPELYQLVTTDRQ